MGVCYPLDVCKDQRKKEFVALRMERGLFLVLMGKAQEQGQDLSETIRQLIKDSLSEQELRYARGEI